MQSPYELVFHFWVYTQRNEKQSIKQMFVYQAALFTIVKRWKQSKNTSRDEQKNKMWHIQWNIIQSLKRHEALTHMSEPWKYYAKWKKRQTQKATHIWFHFYEMSRIGKSMVGRRRPNQSILKEINPQYSLEELMLKLKLQYFVQLIQRSDPLEKTLILGKTESRRRRGWLRTRRLDGITDSMDMSLSLQEMVKDRGARCAAACGRIKSDMTEQLNNNSNWDRKEISGCQRLGEGSQGDRLWVLKYDLNAFQLRKVLTLYAKPCPRSFIHSLSFNPYTVL